jgi:CheY-like chemotaxis protein
VKESRLGAILICFEVAVRSGPANGRASDREPPYRVFRQEATGRTSALLYAAAMLGGEKVSLLIVEDDPNIRYLMEEAAARTGVFQRVASAPDGSAALEFLKQANLRELPDFVVTDLCMPRMTGIELLRAMKADLALRSIPVAVITSSNIPNDRDDAIAAGACSFVQKPHGLDALVKVLLTLRVSCVEAALARHHSAA